MKNLSNLGTILNKNEQKVINGGGTERYHGMCTNGTTYTFVFDSDWSAEKRQQEHNAVVRNLCGRGNEAAVVSGSTNVIE